MLPEDKRMNLWCILLLFILLTVLLPGHFHTGDMGYWKEWSLYLFKNGLGAAYHSGINYPPVMLYILYLFGLLQGSEVKIADNISTLRIFITFLDFLPALLILLNKNFLPEQKKRIWFLLLNIAYLYNSLIWGQVDGISSNLILYSIVFASGLPVLSVMFFVLAINMKLQMVIFLPLMILMLWPGLKKASFVVRLAITALMTQGIILLPFFLGGSLPGLWKVISHAVDFYPYVSMNAFNIWYLICGTNPTEINDATHFLLVSYKQAGLLLFSIFAVLIILPLFIKVIKSKNLLTDNKSIGIVYLTGGLLAIAFFYLNTQMHERYAHPAIILFFFYALNSRNYIFFIVSSIAYFLNLEKVLQFLPLSHKTAIFHPVLISILFLIILITGIYVLYRTVLYRKVTSRAILSPDQLLP
jgi:Gpi18-like mannosyltransferase